MKALALILPTLALAACGEPVQNPPEPGQTVALPPIEWRVRDRAGLEAAYETSGMLIRRGVPGSAVHRQDDRLSGFVGRDDQGWVIYTLPPERVDDAVACTLGHEVMHVVLWEYHR